MYKFKNMHVLLSTQCAYQWSNNIVSFPSIAGPFSACGGCWTAGISCDNGQSATLHSGYYDMCFKVPHLRSKSPLPLEQDLRRPPNVSKTIDDAFVLQFISRYVILTHAWEDAVSCVDVYRYGTACGLFGVYHCLSRE